MPEAQAGIQGARTAGGRFVGRDDYSINVGDINAPVSLNVGAGYSRPDYHHDARPIVEYYTRTFIGRQAECRQIADFAAAYQPGYLLVEALPGFGKSALIASLVHRYQSGRWPHPTLPILLYYFIRSGAARDTPLKFLQSLNAQLLELLELAGGVANDLASLDTQFSQLWAAAVQGTTADAPLLLLIDGLDEMAPGPQNIADYLPAALGPYVHVVVASRPNPPPRQRVDVAHPLHQAPGILLNTFDLPEITALLLEYGAAVAQAPKMAAGVFQITGGQPLFTRSVSQEVAQKGEAALAKLAKDPPQNVTEYFRQEVQRLTKAAPGLSTAKGKVAWNTLGLLYLARGGMTTGEVAEVLDKAKRQVDEALEPIRRFLIGQERLELMHAEFRNALAAEFGKKDLQKLEKSLLNWCRAYHTVNWPENTPFYILAHYAAQLADAGDLETLFDAVLNPTFRQRQRDIFGDASTTLNDLHLTMNAALNHNRLLTALACVAAYRDTVRSESIAGAIFKAVQERDFERALRLAGLYGHVPDWGRVLYLYLAWEAALLVGHVSNVTPPTRHVSYVTSLVAKATSLPLVQAEKFCDALLARIAWTLGRGDRDAAQGHLATFGRAHDAATLLDTYRLAEAIPPAEARHVLDQLLPQLEQLRQLMEAGDSEAISAGEFLDNMAEEGRAKAGDLRRLLRQVAAEPEGWQAMNHLLDTMLGDPYPRYRDIGLVAVGEVIAAIPDDGEVRLALQRLLAVTLDAEGVTYTFDLPFLLLKEARRRGLPEEALFDLPDYCWRAEGQIDRWGTPLRGWSARAAAAIRLGDIGDFDTLASLADPNQPRGFAGYATGHLLALANRWWEFGRPPQIFAPILHHGSRTLADEMRHQADYVRDVRFRHDLQALVKTYLEWGQVATYDTDSGVATAAAITDATTRLAFVEHLSARWSWPADNPNWAGLRGLLPLALTSGTTLDALLARIMGLYLTQARDQVSDDQLVEAIRLCSTSLMTGRPWEYAAPIEIE